MKKKTFGRIRKILGGLIGPLVVLAVLPAPASAYPRPGVTERVSVASNGAEATAGSTLMDPAISADGRHITFAHVASNLVPGDTNETHDVFVHDRATGTTERISVAFDGHEAEAGSYNPAISADGRHVAFQSEATNLVPGDTNETHDVFVHDRATGTTERVSVASDGTQGDWYSSRPVIDDDGRHVAFESGASNLISGDTNGVQDVLVHDRATGTTERISVASDGTEANANAFTPTISADGGQVAFQSPASDLVPGDTNGAFDVFVHDRATGVTERVSVASDGTEGTAGDNSHDPAISADGRHVAFASYATNLVPADLNVRFDVFVHDRATGVTERVSVASDGRESNANSFLAAISADGRHVAFESNASNLVAADTNVELDLFVHDRAIGVTERVSVASDGAEADNSSYRPAMTPDGRHVAFLSYASNLVPGDTNGAPDVFVHDRGGSLGVVGTPSIIKLPGAVSVSGQASFSGATLTGASDPEEDGTGTAAAAQAGAELTGAALIYRHEHEDLLLRLDLFSLPSDPAGAGLPGVLYGMEFEVGETRYEVRAARAGSTSTTPRIPHVALYRCDVTCLEHARLTGSLGTTAAQVLVSVPLSDLGASEGTQLSGLRVFTAAGEAIGGALVDLDEVALSPSTIPASRVELGIGDAASPEDDVAFTEAPVLRSGDFSGSLPTDGLPPGSYRVWTRACLGDICGQAVFGDVGL